MESTSIPVQTTAETKKWTSVSRAQLQWLQLCNRKENDRDLHSHNTSLDENGFTAVRADVGKVEDIVGHFLRIGLNTSLVRKNEGGSRLTKAVCLHMAPVKDEDFRLEIWIGFWTGQTVSQLMSTAGDLRDVLGDYLYEVTESSRTKPSVQLTRVEMDFKLELMLGFAEGFEIFQTVFP